MISGDFYDNLNTYEDWKRFFNSRLKVNRFSFDPSDFIDDSGKVRFVHFSPNVDKIITSGSIFVSGGGLFGVVYVTPLRRDSKVHNLGRYIAEKEIPQSGGKISDHCLVFEIGKDDYLESIKNGEVNYVFDSEIFCDCAKILNDKHSMLNQAITETEEISDCLKRGRYDDHQLWGLVQNYFEKFSFMKHVFFEALIEYLYINQDTEESHQYATNGELYASEIKDYIFEVSPELKSSFSTSRFETGLSVHIDKLGKSANKIIRSFDDEDFSKFMKARLSFYFSQMLKMGNRPIIGRFILKSSDSDSRQPIEQCGAEKIWNRTRNCSALHYSSVPKGEWGITPATGKIKVYSGNYSNGIVKGLTPISLEIETRILNNKEAVLRIK